ncbi:MAG: ornithine racemase Orr [Bacilli bacterium]
MFPCIEINLSKLKHNATTILALCEKQGISSCFLVTKMLAGDLKTASMLATCGFSHLADSRIENLIKFKNISLPKVLLRLPMPSEVNKVVKYCDISLNSELLTIIKLNDAALRQNKVHQIIYMFDLGDLREGHFYQNEYLETIRIINQLVGIKLVGIGTNLTCYGGVIPTPSILNELLAIKRNIENSLNISLPIISGGNSSSITLLENHQLPKGINNLRLGESLVLGRETAFGKPIANTFSDSFIVKAEIIEVKTKPSYPLGVLGMNSFGEKPDIIDKGLMKRAILALGKQDVLPDNLKPLDPLISIIGASSDHLIVDLGLSKYEVGDIISFTINYPGLLQLMTSKYVKKEYVM